MYGQPLDSTLYNLYNSVSEAIHKKKYLPKYIMLLPDHDLILHIDYFEPGVVYILQQALDWLPKQIDRVITICQDALMNRSVGAVSKEDTRIYGSNWSTGLSSKTSIPIL